MGGERAASITNDGVYTRRFSQDDGGEVVGERENVLECSLLDVTDIRLDTPWPMPMRHGLHLTPSSVHASVAAHVHVFVYGFTT